MKRKIVIGITGASGAIYPNRLITKLLGIKNQWEELAVVMTDNAMQVWEIETGQRFEKLKGVRYFEKNDFNAPFASGSAQYDTMILIPCSMGTMARIANGNSNDLITRAADVILKERRRLICVIRETPYNIIQIRNMEVLTLAGAIICPASPSFYSIPKTIEELVDTVVDRILDLAGFDISSSRWGG